MNVVDALNGLWNTILDITEMFVIPDWNSVIGLMPLLIFLGVVGPLVTFLVLGIVAYQVTKPRAHLKLAEGPQVARARLGRPADLSAGLAVLPRPRADLPDGHDPLRTRR